MANIQSQDEGSGVGAAFTSVLSSLQNQRRRIEVISNNIANMNTVGYKASRMTFLETLGQTMGALYTPFQQGKFTATNSPTDLAIDGRSFFVVRSGDKQQYTRAGAFYFDADGQLVTQNQDVVQGWLMDKIINENTTATSQDTNSDLGQVEDIVLDPDMAVGAIETRNIWVSGNLNAGLSTIQNIVSSSDAFRVNDAGEVRNAVETDGLNDLIQTSTPLVDGDTLEIAGTDDEGNSVSTTFTYGATNDGTTIADLLAVINTAYAGVATATVENGKIVLTDDTGGDSQTTMEITNGTTNTGSFTSSFVVTTDGYTPKATTSIVAYDSFGTEHPLTVEFTKTANNREWAWEVTTEGSETLSAGYSGKISFDSNGEFINNTFDDGSGVLEIDPGNGSHVLAINLNFNGSDGLSALTQYDQSTTVSAKKQDGQASGDLVGTRVDDRGFIIGSFTNGVVKRLAQIALAEFNDPTNLDKDGASNFVPTNFSGKPTIGRPFDLDSKILAGNLEVSNVDLADQFIQMIDAQKGYQAASRIVSTLDRILEETTRFGR